MPSNFVKSHFALTDLNTALRQAGPSITAPLDPTRLCSVQLGSARFGSAPLVFVRFRSTPLVSIRFSSAPLGSPQSGWWGRGEGRGRQRRGGQRARPEWGRSCGALPRAVPQGPGPAAPAVLGQPLGAPRVPVVLAGSGGAREASGEPPGWAGAGFALCRPRWAAQPGGGRGRGPVSAPDTATALPSQGVTVASGTEPWGAAPEEGVAPPPGAGGRQRIPLRHSFPRHKKPSALLPPSSAKGQT